MKSFLRRVFGWFERRWNPDSDEREEHDELVRERLRDRRGPEGPADRGGADATEVDGPPSDP
jgi:hypothetical protein